MPMMSALRNSATLSGTDGTPAANPTARIATAACHRAQRRLRVGAADAIVDDVEAIAAGKCAKPGGQRLLRIEVERSSG